MPDNFEQVLSLWPNCSVPDCPNKCFEPLSDKCFPHWRGLPFLPHDETGSEEVEALYEAERQKVVAEFPDAFDPDGRLRGA